MFPVIAYVVLGCDANAKSKTKDNKQKLPIISARINIFIFCPALFLSQSFSPSCTLAFAQFLRNVSYLIDL